MKLTPWIEAVPDIVAASRNETAPYENSDQLAASAEGNEAMSSETARETFPQQQPGPETQWPPRLPRVWPPVVLLGLFWTVYSVWRWTELGITLGFLGFLILLAVAALVLLLFLGWWLA